jgi:hypothetical protein
LCVGATDNIYFPPPSEEIKISFLLKWFRLLSTERKN